MNALTLMMKQFLNKLKLLDKDTMPLWGIMNAQQMVEQLIMAVEMSYGKLDVKCYTTKDRIPLVKRFLTGNKPLPKNFDNPALKNIDKNLKFPSLESAINTLHIDLDNYELVFTQNPDLTTIHPTFGILNKNEWDIFHKKHFTHHLSQFNLL